MYKRITLFTFICLLALAGIAQNKDTYTILLSAEQIKMHVKLYLPEGAALDSKECVYTGREVKIKF